MAVLTNEERDARDAQAETADERRRCEHGYLARFGSGECPAECEHRTYYVAEGEKCRDCGVVIAR